MTLKVTLGTASFFAGIAMMTMPALADTDLILCNKTSDAIEIAVAFMHPKTGAWTMSAWHKRSKDECKPFEKIKTGLFYYHARSEKGSVWPVKAETDRSYCVPSTAIKRDMSSACGTGDTNRPFKGLTVQPGKFTFNFT
jgi:uncharacterized membrane protein